MADKWGAEQGRHWTLRRPGRCHTLHPTNISQRWKMLRAARLTPVLCYLQLIAQCFALNNPSLSTWCRWISAEQGFGRLGQVIGMPCIAQGARGGLARIKHCLYYSSFPLDAEDRTAKCKSRAAKKAQGVCGDRQATLSPTDRTSETANKLQLPHWPLQIYIQCTRTML